MRPLPAFAPWLLAVAAVLVWAALALWFTPSWLQQEQQARSSAAAALAAAEPAPAPETALPTADQLAARTRTLLQLAADSGLQVVTVTQRLRPDQGAVQGHELVLNAQARYAEVREFIQVALDQDAGLALHRLDLRRNGVGESTLQLELGFTFYQRAGSNP